jgi:phenolic acid decarboxylase
VQDIVDKVGFHAEWVMKLQAIYRCYRQRKLDSLERMKEDWDKAQNYLVAKLANSKVSDQKKAENMTKLQIYRSVGSKIKDEFCDQYLYYKKLMFQLLDTYKLRERYV